LLGGSCGQHIVQAMFARVLRQWCQKRGGVGHLGRGLVTANTLAASADTLMSAATGALMSTPIGALPKCATLGMGRISTSVCPLAQAIWNRSTTPLPCVVPPAA
jgi:hypothetical protein